MHSRLRQCCATAVTALGLRGKARSKPTKNCRERVSPRERGNGSSTEKRERGRFPCDHGIRQDTKQKTEISPHRRATIADCLEMQSLHVQHTQQSRARTGTAAKCRSRSLPHPRPQGAALLVSTTYQSNETNYQIIKRGPFFNLPVERERPRKNHTDSHSHGATATPATSVTLPRVARTSLGRYRCPSMDGSMDGSVGRLSSSFCSHNVRFFEEDLLLLQPP